MSTAVYVLGGFVSLAGLLMGDCNPRANGVVLVVLGLAQIWSWR